MASASLKAIDNLLDDSQSSIIRPTNFSKDILNIPDIEAFSFDTDESDLGPFSCKKRKTSPFKPKSYVENLFEGVDDLLVSYARYTNTPEPLSKIERLKADLEVFNNTPKLTSYPYVSQIERSERRKAYLKEQRLYETKVLHKNITPKKMFTPTNKNISGIISLSPSTPLSPLTPFSTRFQDIPESIKKTILLGVTCYVDVRTGKENRSNCVKKELESLGAKLQRTLTKKVDIIVFKEGTVSTYFKAKELEISMVSTFWIEACKDMQKKVDPKLYPPLKMQKYEDILPYEAIKKRRFRIPKEFKEKYDINYIRSALKSKKKRNAVTDAKHRIKKTTQGDSSKNMLCTKKLNFDNDNINDNTKENIKKTIDADYSFSDFNFQDVPRRVSAPASIGRRQITQKRLFQSNLQKENIDPKETNMSVNTPKKTNEINNDIHKNNLINDTPKKDNLFKSFIDLTEDTPEPEKNDDKKLMDEIPNTIETKRKIKRPLYTNNTYIDTGCTIPSPVFPPFYADETNSQKSSTKGKKNGIKCHRIRPNEIMEDLQKEINEGKTTRDSISCFLTSKKPPFKSQPSTIVFTSLSRHEILECERIIKKLGVFEIESNVSKRTTHVVSNGPRRTINLLKGLVRGCWILDLKWLYKSDIANTYVLEDQFELTSFSSAVVQNRQERNAFKDDYHMDLFSSCGPIYVSRQSIPPNADLTELVKLCQGKIAANSSAAEIIIGGHRKNNTSAFRVKENWVLDSITQNKLLDINDFKY